MARPIMMPTAKSLKMLTQSEYIVLVNKYLHMSMDELEDCYNNKFLNALDHIVIRIILKAMKQGDVLALEGLLQRVIGKSYIRPKLIDPDDMDEGKEKEEKSFKIEVVASGVKIT